MDAILKAHSTFDLSDKQLILQLPAKIRAKEHRLVGSLYKISWVWHIKGKSYIPNRIWLLISQATFPPDKRVAGLVRHISGRWRAPWVTEWLVLSVLSGQQWATVMEMVPVTAPYTNTILTHWRWKPCIHSGSYNAGLQNIVSWICGRVYVKRERVVQNTMFCCFSACHHSKAMRAPGFPFAV